MNDNIIYCNTQTNKTETNTLLYLKSIFNKRLLTTCNEPSKYL